MNDPLAVALAAVIAIVLLGGGLLGGAIWGLARENSSLHQRITDLGAYCQEIRDYVADVLGVDDPDDVEEPTDVDADQPDAGLGPATTPTASAIDAGHEELVASARGRHHQREDHR